MFQSLVHTFFGCAHSRTTFPMTRGRGNRMVASQNAARRGPYVVCLDCGTEFAYDWTTMRVGDPIATPVMSAPVVAVPQRVPEAQPMFR